MLHSRSERLPGAIGTGQCRNAARPHRGSAADPLGPLGTSRALPGSRAGPSSACQGLPGSTQCQGSSRLARTKLSASRGPLRTEPQPSESSQGRGGRVQGLRSPRLPRHGATQHLPQKSCRAFRVSHAIVYDAKPQSRLLHVASRALGRCIALRQLLVESQGVSQELLCLAPPASLLGKEAPPKAEGRRVLQLGIAILQELLGSGSPLLGGAEVVDRAEVGDHAAKDLVGELESRASLRRSQGRGMASRQQLAERHRVIHRAPKTCPGRRIPRIKSLEHGRDCLARP
eukprot:scaffold7815_cov248-Pinguiococcus_pyrenoidosus.AAC.3